MLVTLDSYYDRLHQLINDEPLSVSISSLGIYAGITAEGKNMHNKGGKLESKAYLLLEALKEVDEVEILIGLNTFHSCKGKDEDPCQDCIEKHTGTHQRLIHHKENWPDFDWKFATESQLKCVIFDFDDDNYTILVGGRNLTDSPWADVCFELNTNKGKTDLLELYDELFDGAKQVTEDNLAEQIEMEFDL